MQLVAGLCLRRPGFSHCSRPCSGRDAAGCGSGSCSLARHLILPDRLSHPSFVCMCRAIQAFLNKFRRGLFDHPDAEFKCGHFGSNILQHAASSERSDGRCFQDDSIYVM